MFFLLISSKEQKICPCLLPAPSQKNLVLFLWYHDHFDSKKPRYHKPGIMN